MTLAAVLTTTVVVLEYALKIFAIGTVPENRRPAASSAWLLLILFVPVVGFPLYWLIGSPYVSGRRHVVQQRANQVLADRKDLWPVMPEGADPDRTLASVLAMNQRLTGLPCVSGAHEQTYPDTGDYFAAIAEAIDDAREYVHVEFYIVCWDEATDVVFEAMRRAASRGVEVRLLLDHLGSRKYPGRKQLGPRMTEAGIDWHLMMPIDPLKGRWRRPDLRNHRKLVVVDGERAFLGSHNLIAPSYGSTKNAEMGRAWSDVSLQVSGDIVTSVSVVFATDWYTETGELLDVERYFADQPDQPAGGRGHAMQLVPSGPGYATEPNLRLFTALIHGATDRVAITSPYFVPDEALLAAITSASYRGVQVELFVGEKADQFLVGHAQRSYYAALLDAGVTIHLYPAPTVLHGKYFTVDGRVAMIGSSNMDFRSFALTSEIMLLAFGGDLVERLERNDADYRAVSRVLTVEEWSARSWREKYVDNVCRLTAALM
ncbi:cardiolipin synthase [Nocardioides alpinus]|uniref:Cardiolipin synthase n=1 Tax=Nocardioides alpinus TaxID=748909 RepID=A0A1I1AVJ0_9ACTN|nr:cardiolipin synthase [Nocardioides alpinus]PKH40925.1 cardiolipin synthase [Nocardioides alpinus]SFB42089.1 cardiolipin synthase [Nocardioides alpinus]